MKLDIRNIRPEDATVIVFSDDGEIEKYNNAQVKIEKDDYSTYVNFNEIDDLITALEKAKELWYY